MRIRLTNGEVIEVPANARSIEISDLDGKLGMLIVPRHQRVDIYTPGDTVFDRYAEHLKLPTSELHRIPMPTAA